MSNSKPRRTKSFLLSVVVAIVVALGLVLATPGSGHAQITQHFGSQITIISSPTQAYTAMASDSSGNLYIVDQVNSVVYKETLSGGTYAQSIIVPDGFTTSGGVKNPLGIAVDSSGSVYVADVGNERLLKETPAGGGTYTQTVIMQNSSGNFVNPYSVAVDSSGDVFISVEMYSSSLSAYVWQISKFTPAGGGTYTASIVPLTGLNYPAGLAVDSSNNLYICNSGVPQVLKETLSGGTYTQSIVVDDSVFNWLANPGYIAVDNNGDVFVLNSAGGYDANTVIEAVPIGGSYHYRLLGAAFAPTGVTTDSSGNVYVSTTVPGGNYAVVELSTPSTNLGSVNVGSTSAVFTMPFTFSTATTYGQTGAANSEGAAGEFVDTGTGTCDTGGPSKFYAAGTGCTVNVTFSPKFAGTRQGVVEVVNDAGILIAEQFITGTGLGPQVSFTPGNVTTFGTFSSPTGVAVDGKGVLYVADGGSNNLIFTETPSGGSYTQGGLATNQFGNSLVYGVAVDGADNVSYGYVNGGLSYVAQVQPIVPTGYNGYFVANNGEGNNLNTPKGIAADSGGNIYIADSGNNRVVEVLYSSGSNYDQPSTWQINVATGLSNPSGVAVDGSGNVYIADTGNNRVLKEAPSGAGFFAQSIVVNSGLSAPTGVAVDNIGNLYISDTGNKRVLKETVSGSSFAQSVVLSTGLGSPQGLTLDASGNLFIADSTNKVIVKMAQGTAPSLTFASTAVGSTSSDSPQTVTLSNVGTSALTLPIPGTGNNPSISTNFSLSSTGGTACPLVSSTAGSPGTLAANASCTLPISFVPTTSGSLSGSLVLTDNTLSVVGSTQSISFNGTGTSPSAPIAGLSPSIEPFVNTPVGTTASALNITLSNTGTATLSITSVTIGGANPTDFAITTNTCGSSLAISSTCMISVTFTPAAAASYTATLSVADNATGSPQTVALTGTGTVPIAGLSPANVPFATTPVGTTATAQNITLSNTGGATLNISSVAIGGTNPTDFAIAANTCGSTLAASSTCTISVTFTPAAAASYTAALSVGDNATGSPQTVTLTGTGTAPIAGLSPATVPFVNTPVGTTATAQNVTFSNTGGAPLAISSVTIGGTNPTDFAISANTCGSSLAASSTCTISVTFTPASAVNFAATLSVTDNASGSPQTVTLTGTGIAPQANLSPGTVPFSSTAVGTTATAQNITLSNPGNATLTITSVTLGGTSPSDFAISANTCGSALAPAGNCTISVIFTPASAASFTATVTVVDNATGSPHSVALTGTGTAPLVPQAVLTPSSVPFATTAVGSTAAAQSLTLTNPGNAALTITSVALGGANPTDFTISANTCGTTLAASGTCTISVTFTPASAASFTAVLSVTDNAGGSPQTSTLTGTGTSSVANFSLTPAPQSLKVTGGSIAQFTITGSGVGGSFTNPISLSVSGLPAGTTGSFAPATITPGSAGATSVLSIQTPSNYVHSTRPPIPGDKNSSSLFAWLLLLPLLGVRKVRRRLARLPRMTAVLLLAACCGALALAGCGGGYYAPQPHTYSLTVTGQSGATLSTTTVSLTIQ